MVSIIIPVYNEEKAIGKALDNLLYHQGIEVIVVDGGSADETAGIIKNYPVKYINTTKGRAHQLNKGAREAKGEILLFLHADCVLEEGSIKRIEEAVGGGFVGGCLSQRIDSNKFIYRCIEASGNVRARSFKIFYGDQAIFARKDIFSKLGGFDLVELFDDVIFSKKLKAAGKNCILDKKVYASARRWEKQGIIRATVVNWLVSMGFLIGANHSALRRIYKDIR